MQKGRLFPDLPPLLLLAFQTLLEFVHSTAGINEFLPTGKEWVAFGTDVDTLGRYCGKGLKRLATGTCYYRLDMFGMNAFFHLYHLSLRMRRVSSPLVAIRMPHQI